MFKAYGNVNGSNISFNDNSSDMLKLTDNTKLGIGIHGSTTTADLEISHDGTDTIIENKTGNLLISASSNDRIEFRGNITASSDISASRNLYASSSQGNFPDIVVQDLTTGRFYTTASSAVGTTDTFKLTGQRNGDSAITGSFEVTSDITGSNRLLIQKSSGQGTPSAGTSNVAIFQNNSSGQDASIAIIGADNRSSRLHFGRSGSIDRGSIKYLHHGNTNGPDKMIFAVSGSNVVTFSNVSNRGGIGVGSDSKYPTDFFHAQGGLSGKGLMLSSSNGTGITIDRGTLTSLHTIKFNTSQTTKWALGNIGESNDNFYIYSGDATNDKHISLTPTSTNFFTFNNLGNITASGNISASGLLFASSSQGNYSNIVVQDTASGRFYTTSSAALTTAAIETFKSTGQRNGDSVITGSLFLSGSSGHLTASGNIIKNSFPSVNFFVDANR